MSRIQIPPAVFRVTDLTVMRPKSALAWLLQHGYRGVHIPAKEEDYELSWGDRKTWGREAVSEPGILFRHRDDPMQPPLLAMAGDVLTVLPPGTYHHDAVYTVITRPTVVITPED